MLILKGKNVEKYYGDRKILNIRNIKVYERYRIGIVGVNGSGKTTLMNIMTERLLSNKGDIDIKRKLS